MILKRFKTFLTEASVGVDKWTKYFSGKDVTTKVKVSAPLITLDGKRTSIVLEPGTEIVVKSSDTYSTQPIISYQGKDYKFPFSAIDKPIVRKVSFQIKPDQIGIVGDIPITKLLGVIINAVNSKKNIPEEVKDYLIEISKYSFGKSDENTVASMFRSMEPDNSLINTINNDFMEVLGPVYAQKNEKLGISSKAIAYFPSKGNEPLMDFKVKDGAREYVFSSKTGASKQTNTIKAIDILNALSDHKNSDFTEQIKILQIVNNNSALNLPIALAEHLGIDNNVDKSNIRDILNLEKQCIQEINKLDWLPVVRLAIPSLYYIKMNIDKNGVPKLVEITQGSELKKAFWRSKNSPGHFKDKIGIQI